ncbi:MAG: hypothetical protein J6U23_05515 [Clostridiales bacterium]|nr:hypothetical protein [Clostridiales bacterium]
MELKDTVGKMVNGSYKDRFVAEYEQLSIRLLKLDNTIRMIKEKTIDYEPESPIEFLEAQAQVMRVYKKILEKRAIKENITLKEVSLNEE